MTDHKATLILELDDLPSVSVIIDVIEESERSIAIASGLKLAMLDAIEKLNKEHAN